MEWSSVLSPKALAVLAYEPRTDGLNHKCFRSLGCQLPLRFLPVLVGVQIAEHVFSETISFQLFLLDHQGEDFGKQTVDLVFSGSQGSLSNLREVFPVNGTQRLQASASPRHCNDSLACTRLSDQILQQIGLEKWHIHCRDQIQLSAGRGQCGLNSSQWSTAGVQVLHNRAERRELLRAADYPGVSGRNPGPLQGQRQ